MTDVIAEKDGDKMEARDDIYKNLSRLPAHGSLDLFISFQRHKLFTCVFVGCLPKTDSYFLHTNTSIFETSLLLFYLIVTSRCKYLLNSFHSVRHINNLKTIAC